jgi:hypothetical protein
VRATWLLGGKGGGSGGMVCEGSGVCLAKGESRRLCENVSKIQRLRPGGGPKIKFSCGSWVTPRSGYRVASFSHPLYQYYQPWRELLKRVPGPHTPLFCRSLIFRVVLEPPHKRYVRRNASAVPLGLI